MTGRELPKCERCGYPIFKMQTDRERSQVAACGCTEIIGITDDDIPDYWIAPLEDYADRESE